MPTQETPAVPWCASGASHARGTCTASPRTGTNAPSATTSASTRTSRSSRSGSCRRSAGRCARIAPATAAEVSRCCCTTRTLLCTEVSFRPIFCFEPWRLFFLSFSPNFPIFSTFTKTKSSTCLLSLAPFLCPLTTDAFKRCTTEVHKAHS